MIKRYRVILKTASFLILVFFLIMGLLQLNIYLFEENYFPYQKGTKEKAFLNATWRMSFKEVERANNCILKDGLPPLMGLKKYIREDNLLVPNRIEHKIGSKVNIEGSYWWVDYDFFDNQLFSVRICNDVSNLAETDSLIISYLSPRYGKIKKDSLKNFGGTFEKENVIVDISNETYKSKKNKLINRVFIEITYLPIFYEIKETANKDQNNIF